MRRRLLILAVFLLAGAVVNVALAWGCAAWSPINTPISTQIDRPFPTSSLGPWSLPFAPSWLPDSGASIILAPAVEFVMIEYHGIGVSKQHVNHGRKLREWDLYSAGWPLRSLDGLVRHYHLHGVTGELPNGTHEYVDLIRRPANSGAYRPLPLGPIWPGFALNTLLYAAIIWRSNWVIGGGQRTVHGELGGVP